MAILSPLVGDWPVLHGGDSATIRWQARTPQPGTLSLELFAQEAQWSRVLPQTEASRWTSHTVTLRYDWTDAQAEAAGWKRAQNSFSWRDTIRHVGRVAVAFAPNAGETTRSFDLDEFEVQGR